MTGKINNFPTVYYLTLPDSFSRQQDIENQLTYYNIKFRKITCFDGRKIDIRQQCNIVGSYTDNSSISSEVLSVSVSHIKMIYTWWKESTEPYAMFCEDDINFRLIDTWSFNWDTFYKSLPVDWKVIQLSLIRENTVNRSDMKLRRKRWDDWSCGVYLINRSYATEIVTNYYNELTNTYKLDIPGTNHFPIPENIVYPGDYQKCYVIPLFTENRKHQSTLQRPDNNESEKIKNIQNQSSEFITNWWRENGKNVNIKELLMLDKIPVIGTAVVNSTFWVSRLLLSIDYPTENFVIINNNGRGELDEELNRLSQMKHKFVDNIKVVNLPANIGCAGAWNLIIKCFMLSPYWIISNDDVAFGPGLLKEMVEALNSDADLGMIHPNPGDFGLGAWDLFLIRENIVKIFGLFDENTYPAYCEDADYIMRMVHRPIRKVVGTKNSYQHGLDDAKNYYESGSQTQKNEPQLKEKLELANNLNIEYLTKKWGPNWRTLAPTFNVFENQEKNISTTTWDLEFVRKKHLGF